MGRTSRPVRILVHPDLMEWEEIKALQAQGHMIEPLQVHLEQDLEIEADLILGPTCWSMDDSLRPYLLSHALPAARKQAEKRKNG